MINKPIVITNAVTLSDGGTKYLIGYDNEGIEFSILIAQYAFQENFCSPHIPGRLHFNNTPIELRSNFERDVIECLENCSIEGSSNKLSFAKGLKKIENVKSFTEAREKCDNCDIVYLIKHYIINFVRPESYIQIAEKQKGKNHPIKGSRLNLSKN